MTQLNIILMLAIIASSAAIAFCALYVLSQMDRRRRLRDRGQLPVDRRSVVFLFEDEDLVDATPSARQVLAASARDGSAWSRLIGLLLPQYPDIVEQMRGLVDAGSLDIESRDGTSRLLAEWRQGLARLRLVDVDREDAMTEVDKHVLSSLEDEVAVLRAVTETVPYLTWQQSPEGEIIWANAAYLELADTFMQTGMPIWPPHRLFDDLPSPDMTGEEVATRRSVQMPDRSDLCWFEVRSAPVPDGTLHTALAVDAIVQAERGRREFIQTLTKTFATLTVGLAIFDRNRRLALFNPALTDLTRLPFDFLSMRPSMQDFLNRLREARILPEPKDYRNWRARLEDVEAQAEKGLFEEVWTLAGGQSYRVTGRPHPDGAIAFVIEDISADLSMTRRFRSDLELCQSVIDTMPEGIAVFGSDGTLALSNAAYDKVWPGTEGLGGGVLKDMLARWKKGALAESEWQRVAEKVGQKGGLRPEIRFVARRVGGGRLACRFAALPTGAILAGFHELEDVEPPLFHSRSREVVEIA